MSSQTSSPNNAPTPRPQDSGKSTASDAKLHSGYDIETGVLGRARTWVDLFGWIRLGRVLRVAASPILMMLVALTFAVWLPVWNTLLERESLSQLPPLAARASELSRVSLLDWTFYQATSGRELIMNLHTPPLFAARESDPYLTTNSRVRRLLAVLWTIVMWAPVAMVLMRQGAVLTAGRPMLGIGDVVIWARRRYLRALFVALVPALCIAAIVWMIPLVSLVARGFNTPWVTIPASILAVLIAIPAGVLGFGSLFAVPIGWAAVINEADPDPLDSLSRGYEYLLRRPLRLAAYMLVSIGVLVPLTWLVGGIARAAKMVIEGPFEMGGANDTFIEQVTWMLGLLPHLVIYAVTWSLVGGIYLLLRQDAGGQEVEDLWVTPADPPQPLPELKT